MSLADTEEMRVEFPGHEGNTLVASRFVPENITRHPAVLLMHGGGQTRHSWDGTARKLAGLGYEVFAVDARGHGGSDRVDSKNYTFEHFGQDLQVITRQITSETGLPPVVVGASLGGLSALLAQDMQQGDSEQPLFSAIVLVDITPRMERTGVEKILGFMSENVDDGFASVEEAADTIAGYLPNRARPGSSRGLQKNLRQRDDGRWYWHWDPAFVNGPRNISTGNTNWLGRFEEAARHIKVPTLLVRGGKSELVSQSAVEEFLALVPHAEFVDVTDAGHMVAGDRNDAFAAAVAAFLQTIGKSKAPAVG